MTPKHRSQTLVRYTECPNKGHYLLFPLDASPELVDCVRCKGCGKNFEIKELGLGLVHRHDAAVGLTYHAPADDQFELDRFLSTV